MKIIVRNSARKQGTKHQRIEGWKMDEPGERLRVMEALHELRVAALRGDMDAVKHILAKGVPVDQPLQGGWTTLMFACSMAHPPIVAHLLRHGADPNFHKDLLTPLMAACGSAQREERVARCVDLLLWHGGRPNATERRGVSALMLAAKEGHGRVVARLLAHRHCDPDAQDNRGWTALFWAVNQSRVSIVELLVRMGSSVDIRDLNGRTALDLARTKNLNRIVDILEQNLTPLSKLHGEMNNRLNESSDVKSKYEFGKGAETMIQDLLNELTGSINNNGRYGGNIKKLLNSMEFENEMEVLYGHKKLISRLANTINDCCQYSLTLTNDVSTNQQEKQSNSVERSWRNIPYSAVEAKQMLSHSVGTLDALYAGVAYARLHAQGSPPAAMLQDRASCAADLTALSHKALQITRLLCDEISLFHRYAKQLEESADVVPADVVVEYKQASASSHRHIISGCVVAAAFVVILFNSDLFTLSVFK